MTQDEIIEIARQADWPDSLVAPIIMAKLSDFAKLVAAKEREACAKVADYYASGLDRNYSEIIADAIRARGEQA
jgi:hypothetical protein